MSEAEEHGRIAGFVVAIWPLLVPADRRSGHKVQASAGVAGGMVEEVVRPVDGDAVTLRPCPLWCAEAPHFSDDELIHADDGFHHYGTEMEIPTADKFLGMTDGPPVILRAVLTSWTHPLGAEPGPTLIALSLGTADQRTDMCAEITAAEARAVARALLDLASTAERSGRASHPVSESQPRC